MVELVRGGSVINAATPSSFCPELIQRPPFGDGLIRMLDMTSRLNISYQTDSFSGLKVAAILDAKSCATHLFPYYRTELKLSQVHKTDIS